MEKSNIRIIVDYNKFVSVKNEYNTNIIYLCLYFSFHNILLSPCLLINNVMILNVLKRRGR